MSQETPAPSRPDRAPAASGAPNAGPQPGHPGGGHGGHHGIGHGGPHGGRAGHGRRSLGLRAFLSLLASLLRPTEAPLGSAVGRRVNIVSFVLTLVAGLAQGWTLIALGRGLGALLPGVDPDAWRSHLTGAVVAALVAGACLLAVELISRSGAAEQEGAIRRNLLGHLFALGPARAAAHRSGATVSLLTDGAERVALYRQTFLAPTVAAALSPALVLVLVAVTVDWVPALLLAVAVVLVPQFILGLHSRVRRSSSASRSQRMRLSAEYLDAIQGLTTLTLARAAERRAADLCRAGEENRRAVMGLLAGNQLVILITDSLFSLFFITAAAGTALYRLGTGAVGVGDALAVALVAYVLLEPLDHVGAFFYVGMSGMANQRSMRRLLGSRRGDGAEPDDGLPTVPQERDDDAPALSLAHVTASWGSGPQAGGAGGAGQHGQHSPHGRHGGAAGTSSASGAGDADDAGRAVLRDVDLVVFPGERVAVVGTSGAGKSTLVALVSGDLLPTSGTVRVDGTASTTATQDAVRAASAVVAQSTWLFTGTIADNLRVADPTATTERMWQALRAANLADEVRRMPDGLDTLLGEQGLGLSGGQAQRVSLARAFLADRPLLVLDEPTSQVDLDSEAQIVEAIDRLSAGRTVVTVSHRRGALTGADRVLRMADGVVRDVGAEGDPGGPDGGTGQAEPVGSVDPREPAGSAPVDPAVAAGPTVPAQAKEA